MKEKVFKTPLGEIHYYLSSKFTNQPTLVFLPGLTANYHLFDKQVEYFKDTYNIFVWDPPGHGRSRPFKLNFSLTDKVRWLNHIINKEDLDNLYLIGQSMGGYVAQLYTSKFPEKVKGVISLDSSALNPDYYTNIELFLLSHMEGVYHLFPWKVLLKLGSLNVATTDYGKNLMNSMMKDYEGKKEYYDHLVGHGYKMLADFIKQKKNISLNVPVLLVCGKKDKAGSVRHYNRMWSKKTGYPLLWIDGAGHNVNTDKPEEVNEIIESFVKSHP